MTHLPVNLRRETQSQIATRQQRLSDDCTYLQYEVIGRLGVSSHAAVAASAAAYVRKIRFQFELENDDD